jgi:DNA-binding beta-propeller fold protein YncE
MRPDMQYLARATTLSFAAALAAIGTGCGEKAGSTDSGEPATSATVATPGSAAPTAAPAAPAAPPKAATHEGSSIARTARGDALIIADEDHRALRVIELPLGQGKQPTEIAMPGAPAQVLALADRVLVTVRDPGLLVVMKPVEGRLVEAARVPVAADAWGIAVTPDEKTAIVTSAWTHMVTAVDLDGAKVRWSTSVAREPRGVAVKPDGSVAYVSHLVGAALTRLDVASGAETRVNLPAGPLRTPSGKALHAALGFAIAIVEDRLFAARHAIGALGTQAWFGASTVDVLLLAGETPLAPKRAGSAPFMRADKDDRAEDLTLPGAPLGAFTQPRAMVKRERTQSLLVAAEGLDAIVELDAQAIDPTSAVMRTYAVGGGIDPHLNIATTCGAPQGIALSADEATAYVLCRSTYDVAAVKLDSYAAGFEPAAPVVERFAEDPLDKDSATGRRLFFNATDRVMSGGLACSGCHPEGRDDGHVWHEARFNTSDGTNQNFVGTMENLPAEDRVKGHARRTPLLVGRIAAGPYGWHAESPDIRARLVNGFGLHRWGGLPRYQQANLDARAAFLTAFLLRGGLTPPPREERPLTPEEQKGKDIFQSDATRCARCHIPQTDYTDRTAYPLVKRVVPVDFDADPNPAFKTPSLNYLVGHPPYFHDGSAASIEELIERNANRMGQTAHLSSEERAALVAFLKTL